MPAIAEPEVEERVQANAEAAIASKYREKFGFIRKIVPLWGPYWRVNFIDRETGCIPNSYFLRVHGKAVQEMPDEA